MADPIQQIRFLLRQKFNDHISGVDIQGVFILRAKDPAQRKQREKEIVEYRTELTKTPFDQLQILYDNAVAEANKKELEAKQREKEKLDSEIKQFFSNPGIRPDYKYWSRMAFWTKEEAIALTLNYHPPLLEDRDLPLYIKGPLAREARDLKEIVTRAVTARILRDHMRPAAYLAWAKQHGIDFPEAFEALLPKKQNEQESPTKKVIEKSLNTRERETLLKLIIGMAVKKYRYDPLKAKNSATANITSDLHELGITMDDDTVRKWLNEAADFLPQATEKA